MISEKALDHLNPFVRIGERRGRRAGEGELVLRLLRRRLGPLPAARRQVIESLSLQKVEALGVALLDFRTPEDLVRWLRKNAATASTRKTARVPKRTRPS